MHLGAGCMSHGTLVQAWISELPVRAAGWPAGGGWVAMRARDCPVLPTGGQSHNDRCHRDWLRVDAPTLGSVRWRRTGSLNGPGKLQPQRWSAAAGPPCTEAAPSHSESPDVRALSDCGTGTCPLWYSHCIALRLKVHLSCYGCFETVEVKEAAGRVNRGGFRPDFDFDR